LAFRATNPALSYGVGREIPVKGTGGKRGHLKEGKSEPRFRHRALHEEKRAEKLLLGGEDWNQ